MSLNVNTHSIISIDMITIDKYCVIAHIARGSMCYKIIDFCFVILIIIINIRVIIIFI